MEEFKIPTKVFSGNDSLTWLQNISNKKILMVCDAFLPGTPTLDRIKKNVEGKNEVTIFSDVKPDPPLENTMAGVEVFNKVQPNVVIGIGGGSAIDTGKAVRFFGEKLNKYTIDLFVAVPTTSGTGSEVTQHSVLTDTEHHKKAPIMEDSIIPDVALLDPQLVMTAPKSVSAFSGLDVLTHSLESLVAQDSNTITDALAEKAASVILHNLVECYRHGDNEEARKVVHEASCAAGMAFANAGLGIAHSIAHQLGANFHVPHGLACAMMLPHVVLYNASKSEFALHKYAEAFKKSGLVSNSMSDRIAVKRLAAQIQHMMVEMDCPQTLKSFGVDPAEAEKMCDVVVDGAKKDGTFPGNPVVPSDEDLAALYKQVIK